MLSDDGFVELGAAWKRTSGKGTAYLSVKLDTPFGAGPINCALIEPEHEDGEFILVWNRKKTEATV